MFFKVTNTSSLREAFKYKNKLFTFLFYNPSPPHPTPKCGHFQKILWSKTTNFAPKRPILGNFKKCGIGVDTPTPFWKISTIILFFLFEGFPKRPNDKQEEFATIDFKSKTELFKFVINESVAFVFRTK